MIGLDLYLLIVFCNNFRPQAAARPKAPLFYFLYTCNAFFYTCNEKNIYFTATVLNLRDFLIKIFLFRNHFFPQTFIIRPLKLPLFQLSWTSCSLKIIELSILRLRNYTLNTYEFIFVAKPICYSTSVTIVRGNNTKLQYCYITFHKDVQRNITITELQS